MATQNPQNLTILSKSALNYLELYIYYLSKKETSIQLREITIVSKKDLKNSVQSSLNSRPVVNIDCTDQAPSRPAPKIPRFCLPS